MPGLCKSDVREALVKLPPALAPGEKVEALVCCGVLSHQPRCCGGGLLPLRVGGIVCQYTQRLRAEFLNYFFSFFNPRIGGGVILPTKAFCSEAAFAKLQK